MAPMSVHSSNGGRQAAEFTVRCVRASHLAGAHGAAGSRVRDGSTIRQRSVSAAGDARKPAGSFGPRSVQCQIWKPDGEPPVMPEAGSSPRRWIRNVKGEGHDHVVQHRSMPEQEANVRPPAVLNNEFRHGHAVAPATGVVLRACGVVAAAFWSNAWKAYPSRRCRFTVYLAP
jgi:hypothetical protein